MGFETGNIYLDIQEKALRQLVSTYPDLLVSAGHMTPNGETIVSTVSADGTSSRERHLSFADEKPDLVPHTVRSQALTLESGKSYQGKPFFSRAASKWVLPTATPIRDKTGRVLGVLHVELNLESFLRFLKNIINPNDEAFIVDRVVYGDTLKTVLNWTPEETRNLLVQTEDWLFKDVAMVVEARLPYAQGHGEAVTDTAQRLGSLLKLASGELRDLRIAALLHDVGTLQIPVEILNKQGPLTAEEWEMVKTHPAKGEALVCASLKLQGIGPAILHHHENYDGSGYPSGLRRDEIPFPARIIRVVDAYHAMISETPYRRKLTPEEIVEELRKNTGSQFDPEIVEPFLFILEPRGARSS